MSRAWMPLYVADYLADTGHLSAAEHGAYLLLIMHYWTNGGLPNEDRRLARICRMTPAEWDDSRETLFDLFDEGWTHKRIDAELVNAREISEKAKDKANKRWHKPGNADADAAAMPGHMPEPCQSQSPSPTTTEPKGPVVVRAKAPSEAQEIYVILRAVLSDDHTEAVIAHRKKLKKPLTVHAAKLLAGQLSAVTEPNKAADLMISRGWQGFEPDWGVNAGLTLASSQSQSSGEGQAGCFVQVGTEEWDAWSAYLQATTGKKPWFSTCKTHIADGRYFATAWPPRTPDLPTPQSERSEAA